MQSPPGASTYVAYSTALTMSSHTGRRVYMKVVYPAPANGYQ